jgi:hypothetical protein
MTSLPSQEIVGKARRVFRAIFEKLNYLSCDDTGDAGWALFGYAQHQVELLDARLERLGVDTSQGLDPVYGRREEIEELEHARGTLLESYEALALEELDDLTPEEHHGFYRTLRMIVYVHPEGGVELRGEFLPFGSFGLDDTLGDGSGGTPGNNGPGPGGNGAPGSAKSPASCPGFSTNINTRAYAGAATALPAFADHPHQATPAVRKLSRLHGVCPGRRQGARQVF